MRLLVFLFLFCATSVFAQRIWYTVDLTDTHSGKVKVIVLMNTSGAETVSYQMPAWAPGAYAMTNYGRFVSDFKAFGYDGKEKPIKKVNENRWLISHGKDIKTIEYYVSNSFKDSTSLYFALCHIDSNFFFANATALFGYVNDKKDIESEVRYIFPKEWHLYSAFEQIFPIDHPEGYKPKEGIRESIFFTKHYDELADAPVMAGTHIQDTTLTYRNTKWIHFAVSSDRKFEMDSLTAYTKRIVDAQTAFFRDTPFTEYTFLINAPTFLNLPSMFQGALEHANSSAYLLVNLPWENFKQFGPHIISHEFFHLWNVKRIHSSLLGPFDYTKRVKTTSLWLSEGVTDYYSYTLLARNGIISTQTFYSELADLVSKNDRATGKKSLEALSIAESNFHIEDVNTFYYKGTLAGLMLDLEIRTRTKNAKSLDDVMRALNAEAKQGKTFKDKDLFPKIEKIAGVKMQDFYKKYIAGTEPFPIEEYLKKMGLQYVKREKYGSYILPDPAAGTLERAIRKDIAGE